MKLLLNLIEQVTARCSKPEATRILMSLLETSIDKLAVLHRVYEDLVKLTESGKTPDEVFDSFIAVERIKPVDNISYLVDNPDTVLRGKSKRQRLSPGILLM